MTKGAIAINMVLLGPGIEYVSDENAELIWARIHSDMPDLEPEWLTRTILMQYVHRSRPALIEITPVKELSQSDNREHPVRPE